MPVSSKISKKKTKSQSQMLCDSIDAVIHHSRSQRKVFKEIKDNLEFEPGLFKKALGMKLAPDDALQQVTNDVRAWKAEVKADVKTAVLNKKNELRSKRKVRRQNAKGSLPERQTRARRKKQRGGFI
ncbi:MAG: hypothetical protein OXC07_02185 [Kistimonas sp.]|nr:hypothetical protein [Kistimonas sp.]